MAMIKSSAAFALGLWTGAMAVVLLWLIHQGDAARAGSQVPPELAAQLAEKSERIALLEQENARYTAESQRLKETVADLTSNLAARAAAEAIQTRRRIPFFRNLPETAPAEEWIEQAVASDDANALPRLEQAALENSEHALDALATLSRHDGGAALMRVWNSGQLNFVNQTKAIRALALTLEVNTQAENLLRTLFSDTDVDTRLLYAAVDGIASPTLRSGADLPISLPQPGETKPDFALRLRLLDSLRAIATDEQLRTHEDAARGELMRRWAEVEPPPQ
jgi:hypothetical protein